MSTSPTISSIVHNGQHHQQSSFDQPLLNTGFGLKQDDLQSLSSLSPPNNPMSSTTTTSSTNPVSIQPPPMSTAKLLPPPRSSASANVAAMTILSSLPTILTSIPTAPVAASTYNPLNAVFNDIAAHSQSQQQLQPPSNRLSSQSTSSTQPISVSQQQHHQQQAAHLQQQVAQARAGNDDHDDDNDDDDDDNHNNNNSSSNGTPRPRGRPKGWRKVVEGGRKVWKNFEGNLNDDEGEYRDPSRYEATYNPRRSARISTTSVNYYNDLDDDEEQDQVHVSLLQHHQPPQHVPSQLVPSQQLQQQANGGNGTNTLQNGQKITFSRQYISTLINSGYTVHNSSGKVFYWYTNKGILRYFLTGHPISESKQVDYDQIICLPWDQRIGTPLAIKHPISKLQQQRLTAAAANGDNLSDDDKDNVNGDDDSDEDVSAMPGKKDAIIGIVGQPNDVSNTKLFVSKQAHQQDFLNSGLEPPPSQPMEYYDALPMTKKEINDLFESGKETEPESGKKVYWRKPSGQFVYFLSLNQLKPAVSAALSENSDDCIVLPLDAYILPRKLLASSRLPKYVIKGLPYRGNVEQSDDDDDEEEEEQAKKPRRKLSKEDEEYTEGRVKKAKTPKKVSKKRQSTKNVDNEESEYFLSTATTTTTTTTPADDAFAPSGPTKRGRQTVPNQMGEDVDDEDFEVTPSGTKAAQKRAKPIKSTKSKQSEVSMNDGDDDNNLNNEEVNDATFSTRLVLLQRGQAAIVQQQQALNAAIDQHRADIESFQGTFHAYFNH